MFCDPLITPACLIIAGHLAHTAVTSAAGGLLAGLAQAITDGVRWTVTTTATWWTGIGSPDLATEPAVARMQQWLLPITAAVAAGAMIAAGARMAITRKASPLLDVTGGLVTIAAATTLGTVAATLLLKAGDAWSAWILAQSTGGQFTARLSLALNLGGSAAPAVVIVFGVAAIVLSVVQAALLLFRQAALVILAGVLPLAAAGSVAPLTCGWVRKAGAWMLALICYKPAAAAVYAAAFTMIGTGGARTALMGFVMLVLSVLALPALLRFFTWTTGTVATSPGGGQLLGIAATGAIAFGALRSSGGSGSAAQDQATYLSTRLGGPSGAGGPGGGTDGPATPPGTGGPGPGADRLATGAPSSGTRTWPAGAPPGASPGGGAATSTAAPGATPAGAGAGSAGSAAAGTGAASSAGPAGAVVAAAGQAAQASAGQTADAITGSEPPDGA
jgi:hypothetical protein